MSIIKFPKEKIRKSLEQAIEEGIKVTIDDNKMSISIDLDWDVIFEAAEKEAAIESEIIPLKDK